MTLTAFGIGLTAASVAFVPIPAFADVSEVRTSVEVDTSQVGEAGPVIQRRIRERSDVVLRGEGVLPSRGAEDPVILITVLELTDDDPGYAFSLQATRDGEALMHTERFECRLCTETELVAEVETRLSAVIDELETRQAEDEAQAEAAAPEPVAPEPAPVHEDTSDEGSTALGAKGKAGIAVLVVGAAGLGVGIGLAVNEDEVIQDRPTKATSTHLPGYVLIGAGAAAAIVGGVLLGLDRRDARRRTAFAPWLGPSSAGLTVVGRF